MADWLLEVRWFGCPRFQNATAKNVVIVFSDTMTLDVHFGHDKSNLAPDYERCKRTPAPTRSSRYYIQYFYTRISTLIYNSWFRIKNVQSSHGYELSLNDLLGVNRFDLSGFNGCRNDNSDYTNDRHNESPYCINSLVFESFRRPDGGELSDQISNLTKSGRSHPDLGAS
jgi:hypothetical protein